MTKIYNNDNIFNQSSLLSYQQKIVPHSPNISKMETKVNASYRTILVITNVLVNVPGGNDKHMKLIPKHSIIVDDKPLPIIVSQHFRRGDIIDGQFLTKHFFLDENILGQKAHKMVANIFVVEKIDHSKGDKESLILNIYPTDESTILDKAEWKISLGAEIGDVKIPETKRYIAFNKLGN